MYSAYIDNFLNARDAVRIAKEAKPAFHKFLEVSVGQSHRMSCIVWAAALMCCFGKRGNSLDVLVWWNEPFIQLLDPEKGCLYLPMLGECECAYSYRTSESVL